MNLQIRKIDGRRQTNLAVLLKDFDEDGFSFAMAKIRTCIIRGEPQQAHKVLEEFNGCCMRPLLTHETSVRDIGLSPGLSSILESAGYVNYGALMKATRKDLLRIPQVGSIYLGEIKTTLDSIKGNKFVGD